MNWLNIRTSQLREPEFIRAEPIARATWLCVFGYCAEMENGGIIAGARQWKDRQWQQACGVTLKEVVKSEGLLMWNGDDMTVWAYPSDKEKEVRFKRETAKSNGAKGGRPASNLGLYSETKEEPTLVSENNQCDHQRSKAEGEGERNGMELEEESEKKKKDAGLGEGESKAPKSELALEISRLFNRKPDTEWSLKEIKAFKDLGRRKLVTPENLSVLVAYYAAQRAKKDDGRHRRDLATFLNNFDGELDRAIQFRDNPPATNTPRNGHASSRRFPGAECPVDTLPADEPL